MTSYLGIGLVSQSVLQYNMTDLLDLVGLGLVPLGLQVQDFLDPFLPVDVMASADALSEARFQQESVRT